MKAIVHLYRVWCNIKTLALTMKSDRQSAAWDLWVLTHWVLHQDGMITLTNLLPEQYIVWIKCNRYRTISWQMHYGKQFNPSIPWLPKSILSGIHKAGSIWSPSNWMAITHKLCKRLTVRWTCRSKSEIQSNEWTKELVDCTLEPLL